MPTTIKPISLFFDNTTAAPPLFPPMLTDQLELFGKCPHPPSVFDNNNKKVAAALNDAPVGRPFKMAHSSSLYRKKTTIITRKHPRSCCPSPASTLSSLEESDHASESSSDNDDASSILSEDSKIPKPPGEPGQPGRGGYNLETALNWNHKTFVKFKVGQAISSHKDWLMFAMKKFSHHLINKHLNTTKCASAQSPTLIKLVCDKALEMFPNLENYSNCWPVNDIVMMRLKYTSSCARRREIEMAAGKRKSKSSD